VEGVPSRGLTTEGSVVTQLRHVGIFSDHFITSPPQNVPVKTILQIG